VVAAVSHLEMKANMGLSDMKNGSCFIAGVGMQKSSLLKAL
jgi:hypothetical protein